MINDAETLAMVEELVGRANMAMVNTLNAAAHAVLRESQKLAPKETPEQHAARASRAAGAPYPEEQLVDAGGVLIATPENHVAQVVYDSPYAAAQEEGVTTYQSKGGKEVEWHAENYTTPGTGPHYLEDGAKAIMAQVPEELAIQGRIAMGDIPGFRVPKSTLISGGRRIESELQPSGPVATVMNQEEHMATSATTLVTPPSTLPFPPVTQ